MTQDLVELAARALADTYSEKSPHGDPEPEVLRDMIENATRSLRGRVTVNPSDIDNVLEVALSRPAFAAGLEYSRRQIARWFEVPLDDFEQVPMAALQPEVLVRHMYYERKISEWFAEWDYTVEIGEELEGIEGADFIPDVYARLDTLHGNFQVAVTLFCSQPPNTWRVLGMLENIEAFAPKGSEFGSRDIYLMVTPYKFLEEASKHIRIQTHEEDYLVVAVEGNDLQDLEQASDSIGRKERLMDLVESVFKTQSPGQSF